MPSLINRIRHCTAILFSIISIPLLFSTPVSADNDPQKAVLVLPEALNLLYVDGVSYSESFFTRGGGTVELTPGTHRVIVEYEVVWDLTYDDHERVKSDPVMVSFNAAVGKNYAMKLPTFKDIEEAKTYAKKPTVSVIDKATQEAVAIQHAYQSVERTFLQSFIAPAPGPEAFAAAPQPSAPVVQQSTPVGDDTTASANTMPYEMLQFWWNKASQQQRENFIHWTGQSQE